MHSTYEARSLSHEVLLIRHPFYEACYEYFQHVPLMHQCPSFVLLFVIQKVQIALLAFLTFELMTVAFDFFRQK